LGMAYTGSESWATRPGAKAAGVGGAAGVATLGKGTGVGATGAAYGVWGKGYAKFWQAMKYLGGCSAYGR
jgi:hypothetical protein